MKLIFIFTVFSFVLSCGTQENQVKAKKKPVVTPRDISRDEPRVSYETVKPKLKGRTITIQATYAAIECGCAQWVDDKRAGSVL
jgi:hypothetical protein